MPDARDAKEPAPPIGTASLSRRPPTSLVSWAARIAVPISAYGPFQGWRNLHELGLPGDVGGLAVLTFATLAPLPCLLVARRARREAMPAPSAARLAFVVGTLAWVGFLATTREFHRVRVEIALAAGLGAWGWLMLGAGRASSTPSRAATLARKGVSSLCLFALLAEVGLRVAGRVVPSPLLARTAAGVEARIAAYAFAPRALHFGFPCNARGFYDEEFLPPERRGRRALAVIGDSFSASVVPHPLHYTTVCERVLGDVELLNVGWPSLGPDEYLWLLEREVLPLRPDGIVVSLFLGNDLAEVRPWNSFDHLLAGWFDRGNVLLFEVPRRLHALRFRQSRAALPPELGRVAPLEELRTQFPWIDDVTREPATMDEGEYLSAETRNARVFGSLAEGSGSLPERRWKALTRRLLEMRERAAAIPFGAMLIPDEAMVEDALWDRVVAASPGIPLERHALRERLLAFFAASGIPCLDTWPLLRAVPPEADGDRHLYRLRDDHWNVRGNEVAGKALAPFARALLR
ncbi:MAG TPA: hypothetical protein VFI25_01710 [Planctomycetota bacterium]|jgi:hypothetical protein|nr:hypothetical protein [Planctomycetota bacterium]